MSVSKYHIPEADPAAEAAREEYDKTQAVVNLILNDSQPLPSSEFDDDIFYNDLYLDEEDENPRKDKKKSKKAKKREKRALDLIVSYDWEINGAPKTPAEAKERRKSLKRKIKGKKNKSNWREFA